MNEDKRREKFSTNWIIFLLITLVAVMIAGAVLVRGRVDGDGSGELMTAGIGGGTSHYSNMDISGDLAVGDDLTVTDDAVVGGLLRISAQSAISCTNGGYITPTGSYQLLESYDNVGLSSVAIGTAGDLLVMVNTVTTTITLTDTGTLKLGGSRALGQHDSLLLWCDGTNWIELSYVNN